MDEVNMPERLKKRIYLFYAAGVVNLLIGIYVLFFGRSFLPEDKITMLVLFFLGFAALDFWMPVMMQKKWREEQKKFDQERKAMNTQPPPGA